MNIKIYQSKRKYKLGTIRTIRSKLKIIFRNEIYFKNYYYLFLLVVNLNFGRSSPIFSTLLTIISRTADMPFR